jgi:hypothetical protein
LASAASVIGRSVSAPADDGDRSTGDRRTTWEEDKDRTGQDRTTPADCQSVSQSVTAGDRVPMVRVLNAILGFQRAPQPLATGAEIWYEVFVWCFFSSLFLYLLAALVAFLTLRKHKFGRYVLKDRSVLLLPLIPCCRRRSVGQLPQDGGETS